MNSVGRLRRFRRFAAGAVQFSRKRRGSETVLGKSRMLFGGNGRVPQAESLDYGKEGERAVAC